MYLSRSFGKSRDAFINPSEKSMAEASDDGNGGEANVPNEEPEKVDDAAADFAAGFDCFDSDSDDDDPRSTMMIDDDDRR